MAEQTIQVFLSGGGANTDPNASLGGVISTTLLYGNTLTYTSTVLAGVTLLDSGSAVTGVCGDIFFDESLGKLSFIKTGGAGPILGTDDVDVSAGGKFVLTCTEGDVSILVDVVFASLPLADATINLTNAKISQNLYENVLEAESVSGSTKYRHMYLYNPTASPVHVRMYIANNYSSLNILAIGFANTTSGPVDELLVDEFTEPAGVTFNTPLNVDDAITLTFNPTAQLGVFLRRVVPLLADTSVSEDTVNLVIERI